MADRYWVGGTGSWTTTSTAKWSSTFPTYTAASVPTTDDDVFFQETGTYTVTLTGALNARSLTVSAGSVTFSSTGTPSINGSFTLVAGTVWNGTGDITFVSVGGTPPSDVTITTNSVTLACDVVFNRTGTGFTANLGSDLTTVSTKGAVLTAGTLNLNAFKLSVGDFNASGAVTRTLAFGASGVLELTGTGTIFSVSTATNLSFTGSKTVNVTNPSGTSRTITISSSLPEASALNFNFSAGNYALTTGSAVLGNVDFTGYGGTWTITSGTLYGDVTLSATMTVATSAVALSFESTTGVKIFTSNGVVIDRNIEVDALGGGMQLGDNLTLNGARTLTLTAGTFGLNSFTASVGSFSASSGSAVRTLATDTGTLRMITSSSTAFNAGTSPTNFTVTGTGTIAMSGSTITTFVGGGIKTYPTLSVENTTLVTGSNKFKNVVNSPTQLLQFTGGTTNEFDAFNFTGTPGVFSFLQSNNTTPAILKKPTAWNVGANSTNVIGNTGLSFTAGGGIDYLNISYITGQVVNIYNEAIAETATGTDTVSGSSVNVYNVNIVETATGTDSATTIASFIVAISESATGTDAFSYPGSFVYAVSVEETATGTDAVSGSNFNVYNVSILETATGTDTVTVQAGILVASVNEQATALDVTVVAPSIFNATAAEIATALDGLTGATFNVQFAESSTVTDEVTATVVLALWSLIDNTQTPNWQNISTT